MGCSHSSRTISGKIWDPHEDSEGYARRYLAELLKHEVTTAPNSAQVTSGMIELLAYTKTFKAKRLNAWSRPSESQWTHPYLEPVKKPRDSIDAQTGKVREDTSPGLSPWWFAVDSAEDVAEDGTLDLTCVPLIEWYYTKEEEGASTKNRWQPYRHIAGLILIPSGAGGSSSTYTRAGMFEDCWRCWQTDEPRWKEGQRKHITIV